MNYHHSPGFDITSSHRQRVAVAQFELGWPGAIESPEQAREQEKSCFRLLFAPLTATVCLMTVLASLVLSQDSTVGSPQFDVLTLREIYPEALAQARGWRADAYLEQASFSVRLPGEFAGPSARLDFRSATAPAAWLVITINETDDGYALSVNSGNVRNRDRPLGEPIVPGRLALNTAEAVEISLANGGAESIASDGHSTTWRMELRLQNEDETNVAGPLVWRAEYYGPVEGQGLTVVINAETGEVLDVSYRETPPLGQ